jgi:hypothetical protein
MARYSVKWGNDLIPLDTDQQEVLTMTFVLDGTLRDRYFLTDHEGGEGILLAHGLGEKVLSSTSPVIVGQVFADAHALIQHIGTFGDPLRLQILTQLRDAGWFLPTIQPVVVRIWEEAQHKPDHDLTPLQRDIRTVCD